jgi:hypothetical protein
MLDLARLSEEELGDLNRRIVERLRLIRSARQLVDLARFSVGMRVEFTTDDGRTLQGEITRLNRKTATVCCKPSGHWRVSPALPGRSSTTRPTNRRPDASCRSSRIARHDRSARTHSSRFLVEAVDASTTGRSRSAREEPAHVELPALRC